jgi:hypothetical protein
MRVDCLSKERPSTIRNDLRNHAASALDRAPNDLMLAVATRTGSCPATTASYWGLPSDSPGTMRLSPLTQPVVLTTI